MKGRSPAKVTPGSMPEHLLTPRSGWRRRMWLLWVLTGPGLLALLGNNDGGGILSYAVTGAKFGLGFFLPLIVLMTPLSYVVQEVAMRLSAVTRSGFAELLFRYFGSAWGWFALVSLLLINLLTLMTEFIGMTAGLTLVGLPLWLSDLISLALVLSLVAFTGYWAKERLALLVGALTGAFVIVAWVTPPGGSTVIHAFGNWSLPPWADTKEIVWYISATVGNSVAPWMLFFQGNAVLDKGMTKHELPWGRLDTLLGAIAQTVIAMSVLICGAALLGRVQGIESASPGAVLVALTSVIGRWPTILFGLGLFAAACVAAITISLSTAWTIAGACGWTKSLDCRPAEAPKFYGLYMGSLIFAAVAILLPNLPLTKFTVLTQVVGGLVTVPLLIFLVLLTSNRRLMGDQATTSLGRLSNWSAVAVLVVVTCLVVWQVIGG